jgi:hypothetical protein
VYIVRDPYVVFPSTVHLWKRLYETHGMQVPTFAGVEEQVLETFVRVFDRFEADRSLIPAGRLFEMKYEDLVHDPIGVMRQIYDQLHLGDFEAVRPAMERYVAENADYQTNRYTLSDARRDEITRRWRRYAEKYGYLPPKTDLPVESLAVGAKPPRS